MKRKISERLVAAAALSLLLAGYWACRSATWKLAPDEKDFFEKASLIMTGQEKKAFLALPPEERAAFIADFWQRRDPDPESEKNEYKEEFFRRITEADRLFREGGKQGWRSDRGRLYILLGPPERRDVYPTGYSFYDPPVEIWHYGFFTIVFIDQYKMGYYVLDPGSAYALSQINSAQMVMKSDQIPLPSGEDTFTASLKATTSGDEVKIEVFLPLKAINFTQGEGGGANSTRLHVNLEIWKEGRKERISQQQKDFSLSLTAEEVAKMPRYLVLTLNEKLAPGRYIAVAEVENSTDKAKSRKETDFKI